MNPSRVRRAQDAGRWIDLTMKARSGLAVFMNQGNGALVEASSYTTTKTQVNDLVAADFDNDGYPDLAGLHSPLDRLYTFRNTGNGRFEAQVEYFVGPAAEDIHAVDVDLDGNVDLLAVNCGGAEVTLRVLFNDGKGVFSQSATFGFGKALTARHLGTESTMGDLNGDGWIDIAVALARNEAAVSILFNNGREHRIDDTIGC